MVPGTTENSRKVKEEKETAIGLLQYSFQVSLGQR